MNPITLIWRFFSMLNEFIGMSEDILDASRSWTKATKHISKTAAEKWSQSYEEVPPIDEDSPSSKGFDKK